MGMTQVGENWPPSNYWPWLMSARSVPTIGAVFVQRASCIALDTIAQPHARLTVCSGSPPAHSMRSAYSSVSHPGPLCAAGPLNWFAQYTMLRLTRFVVSEHAE